MNNSTLNVNKAFKDQVEKSMNNTFGNSTQPFIKDVITNNNTCVLALIMFHETRTHKVKEIFQNVKLCENTRLFGFRIKVI